MGCSCPDASTIQLHVAPCYFNTPFLLHASSVLLSTLLTISRQNAQCTLAHFPACRPTSCCCPRCSQLLINLLCGLHVSPLQAYIVLLSALLALLPLENAEGPDAEADERLLRELAATKDLDAKIGEQAQGAAVWRASRGVLAPALSDPKPTSPCFPFL